MLLLTFDIVVGVLFWLSIFCFSRINSQLRMSLVLPLSGRSTRYCVSEMDLRYRDRSAGPLISFCVVLCRQCSRSDRRGVDALQNAVTRECRRLDWLYARRIVCLVERYLWQWRPGTQSTKLSWGDRSQIELLLWLRRLSENFAPLTHSVESCAEKLTKPWCLSLRARSGGS